MIYHFSPHIKLWAVLFLFVFGVSVQAQTKTNLELFKILVDSSIAKLLNHTSESQREIFITTELGGSFSVLENQIYESILSRNRMIVNSLNPITSTGVNYFIESAIVVYDEMFRDGFLGEYLIPRKVSLSGSYKISDEKVVAETFYFGYTDTVIVENIKNLENDSYPFTKGNIPTEPFLSNLFEPLVAVTTAAVLITLFFTVRSK